MDISVRALNEKDLPAADAIFRLAFGTLLGLQNPLQFGGDTDCIRTRWRADPSAALGAELDGRLVATNFVTNWGSVGLFGPLTVLPDLWDKGIAHRLLEATLKLFAAWETRHAGLFTHPESVKHIGLYQKFGFWPRFLTAVMSAPVGRKGSWKSVSLFSEASESAKESLLEACREVTGSLYQGLDVTREIVAVSDQKLGDSILIWNGATLAGFAVCHCGPGTEAGSGICYVKFGAARVGPEAEMVFERLLDSCTLFASARGMTHLVAGVNTARHPAYRRMMARGFRAERIGVAMHMPNQPGYHRSDVYAVDDWR